MINKIGKITIYVNNQDEAKEFWTKKINFIFKLEQPMGPNMNWLEVGPNKEEFTSFVIYEKQLMLNQNPEANISHPNIILSTEDIETTYAELKANGVELGELIIMTYGKMFNFRDQDGNNYLVRED
ncbi:VOC family protein [Paraclostridium bifermentans]|jgi:lactoylglutathione lyase|uniref:VOC family protein n=1 Tax=Paraclostridium bifermentans TaxID=1490 RepID=UPI001C10E96D|nr:VOC family protein [Paraclostridium bifermentans]MBU5286990.1 VOC family protein [Paraclostridium bifermentans]